MQGQKKWPKLVTKKVTRKASMARCKHCKLTFTAVRFGHKFCSENCRKLNHKRKNASVANRKRSRRITEKLRKLASCTFGKYLLKEIRRAGTVEALHGHTAQSLKDLVALRRKCTAASGYEKGEPKGTYELSHIWPVAATDCLGLLTPDNLVITPKQFNRAHAQKFPLIGYMGKSIPRESLQTCWLIHEGMDTNKILKLLRAYLGKEFDQWLSGFVISLGQRDTLIRQLQKAGLPQKLLQGMNLQQLKALAEEEDVDYFDIDKEPEDVRSVISYELNRLGLASEMSQALELLHEADWSLDGGGSSFSGSQEEKQAFEIVLVEQAIKCLHGQPYTGIWRDKPVLDWLLKPISVQEVKVERPLVSDDYDDIL